MKMIELELHMYYEPTEEEQVTYVVCEDSYPVWNFRIFPIMLILPSVSAN